MGILQLGDVDQGLELVDEVLGVKGDVFELGEPAADAAVVDEAGLLGVLEEGMDAHDGAAELFEFALDVEKAGERGVGPGEAVVDDFRGEGADKVRQREDFPH